MKLYIPNNILCINWKYIFVFPFIYKLGQQHTHIWSDASMPFSSSQSRCKLYVFESNIFIRRQLLNFLYIFRIFVLWFSTLIGFQLGNFYLDNHVVFDTRLHSPPISIVGQLEPPNISMLPPVDTSPVDDRLAFPLLLLLLLQLTTYL